jgi:NitT/TauT family transport system substrate-binding protein
VALLPFSAGQAPVAGAQSRPHEARHSASEGLRRLCPQSSQRAAHHIALSALGVPTTLAAAPPDGSRPEFAMPLTSFPRLDRRRLLQGAGSAALGLAALPLVGRGVRAAGLKTVRFSEAVHNLGYINLYVGMHSGIFEKNGLDMQVSAAGGDTQTFAAVLGGSADFAIGDATMAVISRENGGPGSVVGTVVQRAHYFAVSKSVDPFTDPKGFKGKTVATSPEPNTNYSVTKRLVESNGMKLGTDVTIVPVQPGTEIAAMLAGQADIAIAYQPGVSQAVAQGARIVFDFSNYIGPFCNTGIMVLPTTVAKDPEMVQALVTSFEQAGRKTYSDPAYAKTIARLEFPDIPGDVADAAIEAEIKYKIPAQTVVTQKDEWDNLMSMQKYLGNIKGTVGYDQVIDNSFADKAAKQAG